MLGDGDITTKPAAEFTKHLVRDVLRADTSFQRHASYSRGYLSADAELFVEDIPSAESVTDGFERLQQKRDLKYDLIIFPNQLDREEYTPERLEMVKSFLIPQGGVLALLPSELKALDISDAAGLPTIEIPIDDASEKIVFGKRFEKDQGNPDCDPHHVIIVERDDGDAFNNVLIPKLSEHLNHEVERVSLMKLTANLITPKTSVICTIELRKPLLAAMSVTEMNSLKIMTDNATNILWITGGGQLDALHPELAMVSGFSRSLILEQPALRFFTFDIDDPEANRGMSVDNILRTVDELHSDNIPDSETVEKNGIAHTSRFVPEEEMNEIFRLKQADKASLKLLGQTKPARLTIKSLGQFDTLAFKQDALNSGELKVNFIEVDVKSVGLNAKDVYVYSGKADTQGATSSLECAGVVSRVGSGVKSLKAGDRVVAMAPGHFATLESFPEWACQKLNDEEDYNVVSTIPLVFATALYGLCYRAAIRTGETVLIHSGAGGLGIAAIQIAQLNGAEVFTTVSTEEKKDFLVKNFGLLAATDGKGVDVVLNSLTGDLLHDSWRACARFGRFFEVGKRDLLDAGNLDMQMFSHNVTFTAFDVSELCDVNDRNLSTVWEKLLREVMRLYRDRKIRAIEPLRVFDASEVSQAFRHFSSKNRIGKIAIFFENDESLVKVLPSKYDTRFYAHKTYLLSGCLGGIGRSISKWMVQRGARKFVFIGRSGLDKEPAQRLVKDLKESGASVHVVRGDVGIYDDVQKCAAAADGPIGGVVQAAMGLDESIFTTMSHTSWHTSVRPKVQGSLNLHNAIQGNDAELDFFLMTSSVAGSVGTATESNYTSANSFLDNFAKYRRRLGVPAAAIGLGMISEVGYLHENPEIEAVLLRKGIQPIKEEELLSIIDITLSRALSTEINEAHVLAGLETQGMKRLRQMGFEVDAHSKKTDAGLPPALAETLEAGGDDEAVLETITTIIVQRLANLILVQAQKIDRDMPLIKWGMDSMLAAEFRTWFFMAFTVDVPFLLLLGESITPQALGELVKKDMLAAGRFVV